MKGLKMKRLDILLSETCGLSRAFCKEIIESGEVMVNGRLCKKPGIKLCAQDVINYNLPKETYVGRGGYKLAHALDAFCCDVTGLACLDVGASTGGFTDCLLKRGASQVYAVDVGTGQLASALRKNPKVVAMEQTDIRKLSTILPGVLFPFAVVDVSFVSLTIVLPAVWELLDKGSRAVCLVKPQFEAGRQSLNKKGVVKTAQARESAVKAVYDWAKANNMFPHKPIMSLIQGGDGNTEYFIQLSKEGKL